MADSIRDDDALALGLGSRDAFERVYRTLSSPLHAFLARAAPERQVATDLLQETWLRVIRSRRVPKRGEEIRPWVFRIAYNLAADQWRALKKKGRPLPESTPAGPDADPSMKAQGRETRAMIDAAVRELPPSQRAVFLLREEGGVPFKEVAEILGIPLGTALARMRYALNRLRRTLRRAAADAER